MFPRPQVTSSMIQTLHSPQTYLGDAETDYEACTRCLIGTEPRTMSVHAWAHAERRNSAARGWLITRASHVGSIYRLCLCVWWLCWRWTSRDLSVRERLLLGNFVGRSWHEAVLRRSLSMFQNQVNLGHFSGPETLAYRVRYTFVFQCNWRRSI